MKRGPTSARSEEHTSELQSLRHLVCRLLLEKKKRAVSHARVDRTTIRPPFSPLVDCERFASSRHPYSRLLGLPGFCKFISNFFFFNDTATTEIYTLSLHDALPI